MSKKKKEPVLKVRNQLARDAWETKKNAAGFHGDKKKEESKRACRGRVFDCPFLIRN